MSQEYLFGRKVLFVDEDCVVFHSDLFEMIWNSAGSTCCLHSDPVLAFHFETMRKRFGELLQGDKCVDVLSVGLAD